MKKVNEINLIPLHYARLTNHPYGTKGEQRDFMIEEAFLKSLQSAFKEVFENCPFGTPEVITTGGIFVDKPGQHGHGRAFDLDAIFWKNQNLVTLNFIHQKELYLGIESFLRKHFGLVLNYMYPNHKDHWHMDNSVPVDYNEASQSETFYVQMVLKNIYKKEILVDGLWGRQTKKMVNEVFSLLTIDTPITTKKNYLKFLDITGKIAFKLCQIKNSPVNLLDNLTEVIDTIPLQNRNAVQEALNTFLDHTETSEWIQSISGDIDSDLDQIITDLINQ